MRGPEMLAKVIESTEGFLIRFVADVDEDARATQMPGLPNHVIWVLGHCAMTMNRLASLIDGEPLPASDYVHGDGTKGDTQRFDTQSVCFDSVPSADARLYPSMERGRVVYADACRRLAGVVRSLDDAALDSTIDWHDIPVRVEDLVMRVGFHNGAHAGQILDLRRAMGLPRVIS